jgi:hypothetical protein
MTPDANRRYGSQRRIQAMECMANRAEASGDIERARDIDLVIFKYAKQPSELQVGK